MAIITPILVSRKRFIARFGISYEVFGATVTEVPGAQDSGNETLWFRRTTNLDEAIEIAVNNLVSERESGIFEARRRLGMLRFIPDKLISALLYPFGRRARAIAEQMEWRKEEIRGHEDMLADIARRRNETGGVASLVDFRPLPDFIPMPFLPRLGQPFWTVSFGADATNASMHITADRISRIVIVEQFSPNQCLFDIRCESDSGASFCGFDLDRENACFRIKKSGVCHHLTWDGAERHARRIARATAIAMADFLLPERTAGAQA